MAESNDSLLADGDGAGLVEVTERQITYSGPAGGASVSIDELARVTIRTADPGPFVSDLFWDFTTEGNQTLTIPGDAENADAIFDVLTSLPGVDYEAATRAATATDHATFAIWEKPTRRH